MKTIKNTRAIKIPPSERERCKKDPYNALDLLSDDDCAFINAYGIVRAWYEYDEEDGEAYVYVTMYDSCD